MNRSSSRSPGTCVTLTLLALVMSAPASTAQTFGIRELPPLTGDPFSMALGLNESGDVVGQSGIGNSIAVAVRWTNGVPESLGTLTGYSASVAFGISEDGSRIVGMSYVPNLGGFALGLGRPVVWENGIVSELPTPGGRAYGETQRIKGSGETCVGAAYDWDSINGFHNDVPCRWDRDDVSGTWTVTALPSLGGTTGGYCVNINSSGTVFGYSDSVSGPYHACRWEAGSSAPVDLGVGDYSAGTEGNDLGESVGMTSSSVAYIWLPLRAHNLPAGTSSLGTISGFSKSWAQCINNAGVVAGVAWGSGSPLEPLNNTRGFIWRNGVMHNAINLIAPGTGWTILKGAWDISQNGLIVGHGVRSGSHRAFVLTPLGDMNCDGNLTFQDAEAFALALVDAAAYQASHPGCDPSRADMNADGLSDGQDVMQFLDLLLQN